LSIIVGFSIIGTLAGTGYYGAGAGAVDDKYKGPHYQHTTERTSAMKRLDRVREKNYPTKAGSKTGKAEGKVAGDIELTEEESGDGYVHLTNLKDEAEKAQQAKEKEEEQKKQDLHHDKMDEHHMDKAPGSMKDSAADRTGENKNVEGGEGTKGAGGEEGKKGVGHLGKKVEGSDEGGEDNAKAQKGDGDDAGKSQQKMDKGDEKSEAGKGTTGMK